ncbi:hypothetical protein Theba_1282 [Mesotoga prima MesG1.Ag.4.2]|uniref:Lipoprotein n=1 Tax=Mesotoga prima MesG1.Ag.4.2 TaxID=660470 RepID=I2F4W7_9BACT|nr:hypothetical protein [Mesotoga prima]AFK06970.1 hypothetical protein Theba_1282 [Mesotoga prima MesG1.Ag.4.2]
MKWMIFSLVIVFLLSGCVPMALMMGPEILPSGTLKQAVGMDLLVGFEESILAPWSFQYLARMGLTEYLEGSLRVAIPSIFISAPAATVEAGAKLGVPGFRNAALLVSGGVFLGKKPSGISRDDYFIPFLRVAPMAGFYIRDWMVGAKLQLFVASEVGIIPGLFLTNGKFYFELDIPFAESTSSPDGGLFGISVAF